MRLTRSAPPGVQLLHRMATNQRKHPLQFGREVVAAEDPFDPASYDALLRIDADRARASFPDLDFDR